ncbi:MAG TPA: sugar ABC transporter permease [Chloroflexota bacterium]|nr:sugar ABC transporter permease [Chloroflexota bacterium]
MTALALPPPNGGASRRAWRDTAVAYLYLAPALILLTLFHFFPAIYGFYISLWRWGIVQERFVGLENYQRVLVDEAFWKSLGTTLWYVLLVIPAEMAIGLAIAYLLFQPIRGRAPYRTAYFLPHVTSTAAAAVVWRWMYNQQNGLLNGVLEMVGLPRSLWLNESSGVFQLALAPAGITLPDVLAGPSLALVAVSVMSVWSYIGLYVVIYLAGLGNISKELYEAARIDGASEWQVFSRITLPLLSPTTFFLAIVGVIGAMQAFNHIYVMTGGGPLDSTRTVTMLVFRTFYQQTRVGYGSAIAFLLALIIVGLTIVNFRFLGRRVHYD